MLEFVDDVLYDYSPLITDVNDEELQSEIRQVANLLASNDYYLGIAANQVGIKKRFFCMRDAKGSDTIRVCINPTFLGLGEIIDQQEICLSFPDKWDAETKRGFAETLRWTSVFASWTTIGGSRRSTTLHGLEALIFQHETDHLNGVTVY